MIYKNTTFKFALFILLILSPVFAAEAATLTWDGGGADNKWSTAANWSPDAVPTSADALVFNSTSQKTATVDQTFTVSTLQIAGNYAGTITQASGVNLTINNGFAQAGGTFQGSDGTFNFNGTSSISGGSFQGGTGKVTQLQYYFFTMSGGVFSSAGDAEFFYIHQTGGTFNAPAGTLTAKAVLNFSAAFNHGGGTIVLNATSFYAPNAVLNNLTANSGTNTIEINGSTVGGTLSLVDGILINNSLKTVGNLSYASTFDGGSTRLHFSDSQTRTVNLPAGSFLLPMILDNPNITVTTSGAGASTIQGASEVKRGTFTQGGAALTFNEYSQSGGTFQGGAQPLVLGNYPTISGGAFQGGTGLITTFRLYVTGGTFSTAGNFDLSFFDLTGGTFNAPAGIFTVVRDFVQTAGGTFNPNNGTVRFTGYSNCNFPGTATGTIDVATTLSFHNLQFDFDGCFTRSVANGDTLIANNNLRLSRGKVNGGRIRAVGAVTIDPGYYPIDNFSRPYAGSTVVEFVAPNRNFVINNTSSNAPMLPVEMNAADSTLTATGTGRILFGGMTLKDGTVNQPNAIWDLSGYAQSGGTFNGSAAQVNVGVALSGGTFNGGTGLVNGSLAQSGGTFSTAGDMDVSSFTITGGICNAPLGTLSIFNGFSHTAGGTFNARTGTVQTSTAAGVYGIGIDVNSTETFYNLKFNGTNNNANHNIGAGDTLIVNGTLTFSGRGVNSGSIAANGAVNYTNYGGYQNATTVVKFQDAAARTVTLTGDCTSYFQPTLVDNPNITVNTGCDNASAVLYWQSLDLRQGTINAGNSRSIFNAEFKQSGGTFNGGNNATNPAMSFGGSFTLSGGDFNPAPITYFYSNYTHTAGGTFNYGSGTVNFIGFGGIYNATIDVNGTENFNNVIFNPPNSLYGKTIAAGDTIVANGNLSITGGGYVGGGTLEAKRNFTISGGFLGGNSNVLFSGAVDQTYTNAGNNSPSGTWTVNKPNSAPREENSFAPEAVTTLFLSGNINNPLLNSPLSPLNIVSGNVTQTAAFNHSLASLTLAANTTFTNLFGGTLTLGGDVANAGRINLDSAGSGCQADAILLRSSVAATQRAWNGAGEFRMVDVNVKDQAGNAFITVFSGTDAGNNGANFVFDATCPPPTSGVVTVGGRVLTAKGSGISKARIVMIDQSGSARYATTNPSGFYSFADVPVGYTFVLTVSHKTAQFAVPTQVLNIAEEMTGVDFIALER